MWHNVSVGPDAFTFRLYDVNLSPVQIFTQLHAALDHLHHHHHEAPSSTVTDDHHPNGDEVIELVNDSHEVVVSLLPDGETPVDLDVDAMTDHWSTLYLCLAFHEHALVEKMLHFHSRSMSKYSSSSSSSTSPTPWVIFSSPVLVFDDAHVPESLRQQLTFMQPLLSLLLATTSPEAAAASSSSSPWAQEKTLLSAHFSENIPVDISTLWIVTGGEIDALDRLMKAIPSLVPVYYVNSSDLARSGTQSHVVDLKMNLPAKVFFYERALTASLGAKPLPSTFLSTSPSHPEQQNEPGRVTFGALCTLHELLILSPSSIDEAALEARARGILLSSAVHAHATLLPLLFSLCLARRWGDTSSRRAAIAAVRSLLSFDSLVGYAAQPIVSQAQAFLELWMTLPCENKGEDVMRKFKSRAQLLSYIALGAWSKEPVDGEEEQMLWTVMWRDFFKRAVTLLDSLLIAAAAAAEREESNDSSSSFSESTELEDVRSDVLAILSLMSDDGAGGSCSEDDPPRSLDDKFRSCEQMFAMHSKRFDQPTLLRFYAMFKQATVGDVNISAPWKIEMVARAKYDAWAALKGTLTKEEAKQKYCDMWLELAAKL